jgi:RNA polymerase sigma-70 factor, ECF subfamily
MKATPDEEFARLIAPNLDALFRAAFRLTNHRADAEDLVQDVCVRALGRPDSVRGAASPRAWLLKTQYHVFVDGTRRRKRSPLAATGEDFDAMRAAEQPSVEDATESELGARRLLAAWRELERDQRALLALHAEGYTLAELEVITDLTTDVLKARLYRARVRLGKLLSAERGEPRLALEHRA